MWPCRVTALVVVVVGCRSEARKPAVRSLPQRDLTLVTQTAHVDIASQWRCSALGSHAQPFVTHGGRPGRRCLCAPSPSRPKSCWRRWRHPPSPSPSR